MQREGVVYHVSMSTKRNQEQGVYRNLRSNQTGEGRHTSGGCCATTSSRKSAHIDATTPCQDCHELPRFERNAQSATADTKRNWEKPSAMPTRHSRGRCSPGIQMAPRPKSGPILSTHDDTTATSGPPSHTPYSRGTTGNARIVGLRRT